MEPNSHNDVCCPPLEPERWDEQIQEWDNKLFVRAKVTCFLYIPLNFGSRMRKLVPKIEAAGTTMPYGMVLSDQTSPWRMELYIAVDKGVPGMPNVSLSGKYISKVYEAPYKEAGRLYKIFTTWVKEKGLEPGKVYVWYATCPGCAKKYGSNKMVFIAAI
jgi:effector-binding domain-containing protein